MEEGLDVGEEVGRREGLVEGRRSKLAGGRASRWAGGGASQRAVGWPQPRQTGSRRLRGWRWSWRGLAKTANTLAAAIGERDGLKEALNSCARDTGIERANFRSEIKELSEA